MIHAVESLGIRSIFLPCITVKGLHDLFDLSNVMTSGEKQAIAECCSPDHRRVSDEPRDWSNPGGTGEARA
jgi:hypothetical protein